MAMSRVMADVYKRFHSEVYKDNSETLWSMDGDKLLSEQIKEEVCYERPKFNFPGGRDHQASTFGLHEQCLQVLKKAGFAQEAKQFDNAFLLTFSNLTYKDIVELVYRFVDFSEDGLTPSQKQLLKIISEKSGAIGAKSDLDEGDDSEEVISFIVKNKTKQNLKTFKSNSSFSEQLECLRSGSKDRNVFGKNYLFCMTNSMAQELIANLLKDFCDKKGGWKKESVSTVVNKSAAGANWLGLEEFEKLYPMGFLEFDNFHTTPMMLASYSFTTQIGIAFFERLQKSAAGYDTKTISRLGWDHKDLTGISGRALWTIGAENVFRKAFNLESKDSANSSAMSEQDCSWVSEVKNRFSTLSELSNEKVVWGIYSFLDPDGALMVKNSIIESAEKSSDFKSSKFKVEYEKYEIALSCSKFLDALNSGEVEEKPLPERYKALLRL